MIFEIEQEAKRRGINRLCHFTPSRNLVHILTGETGILATKHLRTDERSVFTSTDLKRLDRHEGHICCSVQYPNAWYFTKAQSNEKLFKDWVVLLIDPKYLWQEEVRFCPRNAASGGGVHIVEGLAGFSSLFAGKVQGAYGQDRLRQPSHLPCCPTDDQAEVLVPDQIKLIDILAIAVKTEEQARNELARLKYVDVSLEQLRFIIAPKFFDKYSLSDAIRTSVLIEETVYTKVEE